MSSSPMKRIRVAFTAAVGLACGATLRLATFDLTSWSVIISSTITRSAVDGNSANSIDILSSGSASRLEYLEAQRRTFGSHKSVRAFFPVTELNDTDAFCTDSLTMAQVLDVINYCNTTPPITDSLSALMTRLFRPTRQPGWLCAQKRPVEAFYQLLQKYKNGLVIPRYVIIMDDDSFLANVDSLNRLLWKNYPPDVPFVVTTCPISSAGFMIPYGGFGSIFTREAIHNLMHPIDCSSARRREDRRSKLSCDQLEANVIGEKRFFRNGMSIADLMYEYSAQQPFSGVDSWSGRGFCMHSDHALGYFINSYYIALPATARAEVPNPKKPFLTRHGFTRLKKKQCDNKKAACDATTLFCHYIKPDQMDALFIVQVS